MDAPMPLLDLRSSSNSSSSPEHRPSTSISSERVQSEDTADSCEHFRLAANDTPCPSTSRSQWLLDWKMHNTDQDGTRFEESASLLNDPSEKSAEAELKDSSSLQQSTSQTVTSSVQQIYRNPRALARLILRELIPSFISSRSSVDSKPEKLHPTSYLDGIRGIAALAVCLCHFSYTLFVITLGYGQVDTFKEGDELPYEGYEISKPGDNNRLVQLPFLRLIYSGPPMVAMFFIISGYALSNKPIRQMRSRSYDSLLSTMSSSIFRRGLRLFLPCFASTFIVFIMVRLGLYEITRTLYSNKELFRNINETHVARGNNIIDQFVHWSMQMWDFVHPWDWFAFGGSTQYDRHLWTIPVEYRASLVLFLSLVGLAKVTSPLRLTSYVALSFWALRWDRWEMPLFWFGALFAEVDQIKVARASVTPDLPMSNGSDSLVRSQLRIPSSQMPTKLRSAFWIANFICGLYLCSFPDERGITTPGFVTLARMIPAWYAEKYRFWQSFGAIQVIWACTNMRFLQRLFEGPVVQYLGKISYAMYIMHGPVIHTIGWGMMGVFWNLFGSETRTQWEMGFALSALITFPCIIWAADIFWRAVDIPCVKFARWLEVKCTVTATGR